MNLDYLKAFYTTVKENSISKTAKLLHMSQPGVSVQIQALEKELGFQLLVRSNKGVMLTDAGKIVYDYAVSLLSIKKDIERDLDSLRTHIQEMVVSSCTTVGSYALPCSIYLFKKKYPNVKILLDICNSATVVNNLLNNSSHIGILQSKPSDHRIETIKVTSDNLHLICSMRYSQNNKISLDELTQMPLIVREKGSGCRQCMEESLRQLGISMEDMNIVLELTSTEAIKSAVLAGKGCALLPELAIKNELGSGALTKIEIADACFESHYFLAYLKGRHLKEPEREFNNFIKSSRRGFC